MIVDVRDENSRGFGLPPPQILLRLETLFLAFSD
jgi:hypothetical protein